MRSSFLVRYGVQVRIFIQFYLLCTMALLTYLWILGLSSTPGASWQFLRVCNDVLGISPEYVDGSQSVKRRVQNFPCITVVIVRNINNLHVLFLNAVQVWDTAGQERFRSMAPMYYRNANAALLVFDITHYYTFTSIKSWIKGIETIIQ